MECKTWRSIIKKHSQKELKECFSGMASHWEVCAVGHQIGLSTTFSKHESHDWDDILTPRATKLGMDFYYAINEGDKKKALATLLEIEKLKNPIKRSVGNIKYCKPIE